MTGDEDGQDAALRAFRAREDDRRSREYLRFFGPVTRLFSEQLADRLGPGHHGVAVDLGCGDGVITDRLAAAGWRSVAVDRSYAMVDRVPRDGNGRRRALVADALRLPLARGGAGAVLSAFLLPHLPDVAPALREIRRVTVTGGRLLSASWAATDRSPLTGLAIDLARPHLPAERRELLADLDRRTDPDWLRGQLAAAGFVDVTVDRASCMALAGSPQEWWNSLMRGSFGLSSLLTMCPPAARNKIREDFLEQAGELAPAGEVVTTAAAVVVDATAG